MLSPGFEPVFGVPVDILPEEFAFGIPELLPIVSTLLLLLTE
jgi:hypothetical protein